MKVSRKLFHAARFSDVPPPLARGRGAGGALDGGALLYSLWPGYLERDRLDLRQWARERGVAFHLVHSSGHAHPEDLRRMAEALRPERLMPIHSAVPARYEELYPAIQRAGNGEWIDI